jgi:membrane protease YdiL (CAAX protease family)
MPLANGQTVLDGIIFLIAVGALPAFSIYTGTRIARNPAGPLIRRYWLTIARGAVVAGLLLGLWRWTERPFSALGLALPPPAAGLYCLALVGILALAMAVQIVLFDRIVKPARLAKLRAQLPDIKILPRTTSELSVFVLVAVMAGIWEELLYRGFLIWYLRPFASLWGAVALSTAAFAIGHIYQGWRGIPRAGLLGLLFAVGYVATGSLWWLIALHAVVDIYGGFVAWSVLRAPLPAATQSA